MPLIFELHTSYPSTPTKTQTKQPLKDLYVNAFNLTTTFFADKLSLDAIAHPGENT
ncbi:hypothetical protein JOY44_21370 [Phormidium sp. CLA17]|uniref:hypothetical protein n=1 Tax=Leptolyngbya sp. Cla-17 TaxID=2803751 RepID=UPI001492D1CC|nr:hypothetical protein [Leptolyngbya sp. Cla-17]MBM0744132.1 hypothetical protein [Leptolyngbya sp. Cla-17]